MIVIEVTNCDGIVEVTKAVENGEVSTTIESLMTEFPPDGEYEITIKNSVKSLTISGSGPRLNDLGDGRIQIIGKFIYVENIPAICNWLTSER